MFPPSSSRDYIESSLNRRISRVTTTAIPFSKPTSTWGGAWRWGSGHRRRLSEGRRATRGSLEPLSGAPGRRCGSRHQASAASTNYPGGRLSDLARSLRYPSNSSSATPRLIAAFTGSHSTTQLTAASRHRLPSTRRTFMNSGLTAMGPHYLRISPYLVGEGMRERRRFLAQASDVCVRSRPRQLEITCRRAGTQGGSKPRPEAPTPRGTRRRMGRDRDPGS